MSPHSIIPNILIEQHTDIMRKQLLTLVLIASTSLLGFSQSPYLDSLYQAYHSQPDETRYKTLYKYCFMLIQHDAKKGKELMDLGKIAMSKSNLPQKKQAYYNGLFCEVEAMIAQNENDYAESLHALQKCLDFAEQCEEKDKNNLQGIAYWGRGIHYGQQGLYDKSNAELLKAKPAFIKAEQPGKHGDVLAMLAQNYHQLEQYDSTIIYINKAMKLIDNKLDITNQYYYNFFKANAFNAMGEPDSTIALLGGTYLNQAKAVNPILYAHLALALSDAYIEKKAIPQAKQFLNNAQPIVKETNDRQLIHNLLVTTMEFEKVAENHKAAFDALNELKIFEDSMYQKNMADKFMELQSKYETQSKDFEITSLKNKNSYQQNMMWMGGIFFTTLLGLLYFWFKNLDEKRKAIHEKNNQQIRLAFKYNSPEIKEEIVDDFLKRISQHIQDNLDNQDFSVDDLVQYSGMNRNAMNKKLKSMTNKTAVKLIREIRLEKAKSLLMKNGKNVSEIAFEVGFKDPNYFSVCFREQFGVPPSDILKKSLNH